MLTQTLLLTTTTLITLTSAQPPKKLGDVFNVWGVSSSTDPPGKMSHDPHEDPQGHHYLEPRYPGSCAPYYDHSIPLGQSQGAKSLNQQWDTVIRLNHAAMISLSKPGYEGYLHNRNHAKAFFGLEPEWDQQRGKYTTSSTNTNGAIYSHVGRWYTHVQNFITNSFGEDQPKPILMCNSQNIPLLKPSDPMRRGNGDGTLLRDPQTGAFVTVQEHYGEEFLARNHVFLIGRPFWMYMTEEKSEWVEDTWPIDLRTGYSHYCMNVGNHAWTLSGKVRDEEVFLVILCPAVTQNRDRLLAFPEMRRLPIGPEKKLDDYDVQASALYHELFHVVDQEFTPGELSRDDPIVIPRQIEGWPEDAHSWQLFRPQASASKGIEALYQTLYDQTQPNLNPREKLALMSPNTYVWFALISFMSSATQQDWSAGVVRDPRSLWTPVYAKSRRAPGDVISDRKLRGIAYEGAKEYAAKMWQPDGTRRQGTVAGSSKNQGAQT